MKYDVKILRTDEGYAVWCPILPGCWSQGHTEAEALENIRDAIAEYLANGEEAPPVMQAETRTVEVGWDQAEELAMTRSTPHSPTENWEQARDEWVAEVERLAADVERAATGKEWAVKRESKEIVEDGIGAYQVPVLTVRAPTGMVYFNPVARYIIGGPTGRIEIYATPSFAEAVLLRRDGEWRFHTDDLVDLNRPWSEQAFIQTASELLARP